MSLLKVLTLVVCTVSLAILLPTTVKAVDHPWDDRSLDSSHVTGEVNNGNSVEPPRPYVDEPIIQKFFTWTRQWLREVRELFTNRAKEEPRERIVDNSNSQQPTKTVVNRKPK